MRAVLKSIAILVALAASAWAVFRVLNPAVLMPDVAGTVAVVANPHAPRSAWQTTPLVAASIRIEWSADIDVLVDTGHACIRGLDMRTAANGGFSVPAWEAGAKVRDIEWQVRILEPGFEEMTSDLDSTGKRHVYVRRLPADESAPTALQRLNCWQYPPRE